MESLVRDEIKDGVREEIYHPFGTHSSTGAFTSSVSLTEAIPSGQNDTPKGLYRYRNFTHFNRKITRKTSGFLKRNNNNFIERKCNEIFQAW